MQPLRAVIWCAVSTKAQINEGKESLPLQERDARKLCVLNGWEIVSILRVPGHSRRYIDIHDVARDMADQGITAFNELLDFWGNNAFDVLVVRDSERFARTQSLHAYVVERTISIGARIYSFADGWVDETNYRMFIAMAGYKAAGDIDRLVNARKKSILGRMSRGLVIGSQVDYAHKIVRDPKTGKAVSVILDENRIAFFADVATLILEGVAWHMIPEELYKRFNYVNPKTGHIFSHGTIYDLLYRPTFWGHVGSGYEKKLGAWVYDETLPVPEGVELYRNVIPPVYTGELAERIKGELRRRETIMRGKASPNNTHTLTGLLICNKCKYSMSLQIDNGKDKLRYWRCSSRQKSNGRTCTQKAINEQIIREYLAEALTYWAAQDTNNVVIGSEGKPVTDNRQYIEKRILELELTIRTN